MFNGLPSLDPFVLAVVLGLGIIILLAIFSNRIFGLIAKLFAGVSPDALRSVFRVPTIVTAIIIAGFFVVSTAPLPSWVTVYAADIAVTLGVFIWVVTLVQFGDRLLEPEVAERVDSDMAPIIENVWTIVVLLSGAAILLSAWGINLTPFLASAGVVGIVIGFTARETLENFFASLSLYADKTYKTGDYIIINDSTEGYVEDVSIRSTSLRTLDGDTVTIPNAKLNRATIRNKSEPDPIYRLDLRVGVSYDADLKEAKQLLGEVLQNDPEIEMPPEPQVFVYAFEDSAIIMELRMWISDPSEAPTIRDRVNRAAFDALTDAGIEIPYPKRDIRFWNMTDDPEDMAQSRPSVENDSE